MSAPGDAGPAPPVNEGAASGATRRPAWWRWPDRVRLPSLLPRTRMISSVYATVCAESGVGKRVFAAAFALTMTLFLVLALLSPRAGVDLWGRVQSVLSQDMYPRLLSAIDAKPGSIDVSLITFGDAEHPVALRPSPLDRDMIADAIIAAGRGGAHVIVLDINLGAIEAAIDPALTVADAGALTPACEAFWNAEALSPRGVRLPGPHPGETLRDRAIRRAAAERRLATVLRCWPEGPGQAGAGPAIVMPLPDPRPGSLPEDRWLDSAGHVRLASSSFQQDPDGAFRTWTIAEHRPGSEQPRCGIVFAAAWEYLRRAAATTSGATSAGAVAAQRYRAFRDTVRARGGIGHGSVLPACDAEMGAPLTATLRFVGSEAELKPGGGQRPSRAVRDSIWVTRAGDMTINTAFFADRAVVIGAVHGDIRDRVATPLGDMAGVILIANAINGAYDAVMAAPLLVNLALIAMGTVTMLLIILAASSLTAVPKALVIIAVVMAGSVIVHYFSSAAFVYRYLVLSAMITAVLSIVAAVLQFLLRYFQHGWRAAVFLRGPYDSKTASEED